MNITPYDDILVLKQRLCEQDALIMVLREKLNKREIERLQAELNNLRRMNFGHRAEKLSRRIAQRESRLTTLQQQSDPLTDRVDDPAAPRPQRQTRARKAFPGTLPRDDKRLLPLETCCPSEDAAEQLELMHNAFRVIRTVREKQTCRRCDRIIEAPTPSRSIEGDIAVPERLPTNKKAKTGRLWTDECDGHNAGSPQPPAVWFAYSPDRKGILPQPHIADFSGVLQVGEGG